MASALVQRGCYHISCSVLRSLSRLLMRLGDCVAKWLGATHKQYCFALCSTLHALLCLPHKFANIVLLCDQTSALNINACERVQHIPPHCVAVAWFLGGHPAPRSRRNNATVQHIASTMLHSHRVNHAHAAQLGAIQTRSFCVKVNDATTQRCHSVNHVAAPFPVR